jgi:HSP20 family protein
MTMAETVSKVPVTNDNLPAKPSERSWHPFESLRREIDRLFDDFQPFGNRSPFARVMSGLDLASNAWFAPAFDMTEQNGAFAISAELPGIDEKNIELKVANGILTVKGEKSEEKKEEEKDYYLSERRYGSFQRSFELPAGVDADKIEASFSKGVLNIKLPKTADAIKSEKKIDIKAA